MNRFFVKSSFVCFVSLVTCLVAFLSVGARADRTVEAVPAVETASPFFLLANWTL